MERNFLLMIHDATFICAISSQTTVENLNTCNMMIIWDKWNQGDKQYSQPNQYQMMRINNSFARKLMKVLYTITICFSLTRTYHVSFSIKIPNKYWKKYRKHISLSYT